MNSHRLPDLVTGVDGCSLPLDLVEAEQGYR